MTQNQIQGPRDIVAFVKAGKATFTIVSKRTGVRHTYKVVKTDNNDNAFFCSLMTGSDNENSFTYIGMLYNNRGLTTFVDAKAPKIDKNLDSVKGFRWFCENMHKAQLSNHISFFHSGKCGKCGKKLTTPLSVMNAYGPECIKQRNFIAVAA